MQSTVTVEFVAERDERLERVPLEGRSHRHEAARALDGLRITAPRHRLACRIDRTDEQHEMRTWEVQITLDAEFHDQRRGMAEKDGARRDRLGE